LAENPRRPTGPAQRNSRVHRGSADRIHRSCFPLELPERTRTLSPKASPASPIVCSRCASLLPFDTSAHSTRTITPIVRAEALSRPHPHRVRDIGTAVVLSRSASLSGQYGRRQLKWLEAFEF